MLSNFETPLSDLEGGAQTLNPHSYSKSTTFHAKAGQKKARTVPKMVNTEYEVELVSPSLVTYS